MSEEIKNQIFFKRLVTACQDAALITVVFGIVGMLVNLFHPNKIPYIANVEYETLVPCPEPGGLVTPMKAINVSIHMENTLIIDARQKYEHKVWKIKGAINIPYDYLEPITNEDLRELTLWIRRIRARRVVVYGDGKNPDCGEQAGKEISGKGIKNVFFVVGGAPALKREEPGGGS